MTNTEIVKKLVGNIQPAGDAHIDEERFKNLEAMCELVEDLVEEIDNVINYNREAEQNSIVKARKYADDFLQINLGRFD